MPGTLHGKLPADRHPVIYQPFVYKAMKSAAKTMSQYFYTAHSHDLFIHHWIVRGSIDLLKPSYTTFGILTPSSLALVQYLVHGGGTINVC